MRDLTNKSAFLLNKNRIIGKKFIICIMKFGFYIWKSNVRMKKSSIVFGKAIIDVMGRGLRG